MRQKERFVNTLTFKEVDRVPLLEIAVWAQTRERWIHEGMPEDANTSFMYHGSEHFGMEGYESIQLDAISPYPPQETRVLEETEEYLLFVDNIGRTRRALKRGTVGGT